MAADEQGTAHWFGVGATLTNASIQSISATHSFQLEETVEDENGITIATRKDNRLTEATVTVRAKTNYAAPNIGDAVALAGLDDDTFNETYELTNKGGEFVNNQFTEVTLTLQKHENVAVS